MEDIIKKRFLFVWVVLFIGLIISSGMIIPGITSLVGDKNIFYEKNTGLILLMIYPLTFLLLGWALLFMGVSGMGKKVKFEHMFKLNNDVKEGDSENIERAIRSQIRQFKTIILCLCFTWITYILFSVVSILPISLVR
ncbi:MULTISPECIES: hypothetical protein [Clostridium]|uniref:DUF3899 domain-containing protein n=1 Tax=Clostridium frigoriphilum TaxID=443253 RepID=A0ABU7USE4_9CLOT|nr:hypothetical protein [Clostridium sp. DSM 17811]MBU3100648.1 hypothetical protein [Clostridium sp. DSM 17811]